MGGGAGNDKQNKGREVIKLGIDYGDKCTKILQI